MDFKYYFSLFLRRLHWFMLFVVISSAVGVTLAKVLPPVFVAQARLLVESEQIPDELAASTVRTEAPEQLEIIRQRILTRDTLIDMANRLEIYTSGAGETRPRLGADEIVDDMRGRIQFDTTGGSRRGVVNATLVTVGFEAPSAQTAATVVNELVTLILREDVGMRTRVARQTLEFFDQEVDRLDAVLATQGAAIVSFKQDHQNALPDSLEFRRSQQAGAQERLLQLEREEAALKDRRSRLEGLRATYDVSGGPSIGTPQSSEEVRLAQLEEELAAQLSILAPSNPKIKLLKARVESLRQRVQVQRAQTSGVTDQGTPLSNFDLLMSEINGQLEYIARQKAQVSDTLAELAVSIGATPDNAIQLGTLERNHANTRIQYDQAVANQARAQTGDIIEALRQGQRISVIEQATVPSRPEKPNRAVIAAGGIGAGVLFGLTFVCLLELLNRGIRRPVDLTNKLGITPFATLPYYRTKSEKLRRRMIIFGTLGMLLIVVPAGLWAVDTYVMPIDRLINILAERLGLAGQLSKVASTLA
ncbi:lipopolysaccharide biosynthesis protein [Rhodobacteraceae bacterium KMM 6894]|nr:lipopolysaccharide biosynthesis protein [Rhodobacteraceae bacterium KMM 6894]